MSTLQRAMRWRCTRWVLLCANLAAALLGIATLWHGPATRAILGTAPRTIAAPPALVEPPPRVIDMGTLQSAALFHASRRFHEAPPAITTLSPPDYRLAATWMLPNGPPAALVTQNQSGARRKVRVGEELEGWAVSAIDRHSVLLHHGEQRHEMGMPHAAAAGLQPISTPTSTSVNNPSTRGGITLLGQPLAPSDSERGSR